MDFSKFIKNTWSIYIADILSCTLSHAVVHSKLIFMGFNTYYYAWFETEAFDSVDKENKIVSFKLNLMLVSEQIVTSMGLPWRAVIWLDARNTELLRQSREKWDVYHIDRKPYKCMAQLAPSLLAA